MGAYFIGLIFDPRDQLSQNLSGFRKQYDLKYPYQPDLQMTLLPPFTLKSHERDYALSLIEDEVDSFMVGESAASSVRFTTFNSLKGKSHILYLDPVLDDGLHYCLESLEGLLKNFSYLKKKSKKKAFLPVGRFRESWHIQAALSDLVDKVSFPLNLKVESIGLFKKVGPHWVHHRTLFDFELPALTDMAIGL